MNLQKMEKDYVAWCLPYSDEVWPNLSDGVCVCGGGPLGFCHCFKKKERMRRVDFRGEGALVSINHTRVEVWSSLSGKSHKIVRKNTYFLKKEKRTGAAPIMERGPQRSREVDKESSNFRERKRRVDLWRESTLVSDDDTRVGWMDHNKKKWIDNEGWQHEVKNITHKIVK